MALSHWDKEAQKLVYFETREGAKEFFEALVGLKLIMQNAPFDCSMVKTIYGVDLMPSVHTDTLILGHLLNENRSNGLKERGVELFGIAAKREQDEMKASVERNGGRLVKNCFELYKADYELIGRYGAKDAILTLKVFHCDIPELFKQKLDCFFYDDESMPLLRGPTYELNTTGLKVDLERLAALRSELEKFCMEARAEIVREVSPIVKEEYPGTNSKNQFNISSGLQRSWLLYHKLGNVFPGLTKEGRNICKAFNIPTPYSNKAKREFVEFLQANKDRCYTAARYNKKKGKLDREKKIGVYWKYLETGKASLAVFAKKYGWIATYLEYAKSNKLLNTYVDGIEKRIQYGIIRPSFLQHGTTSGRYSSRNPNFQNLPRDDKRVKYCIVSRPGKVFVGADYSQLEPRVFASVSQDEKLLKCFADGDDFYSVIGKEVFGRQGCSLKKDDERSFAKMYPAERQIAKVIALSATYGTTAAKMAPLIGKDIDEAQYIIDSYFYKFPKVKEMMLKAHNEAMDTGVVYNLFGRPRRMPAAMDIPTLYGDTEHKKLPYEARNLLNLAVNHKIQSTAATIVNRAAIAIASAFRNDGVSLVMQIHDELVAEVPEDIAKEIAAHMKNFMELSVELPGVQLVTEPKIAKDLAGLK